MGTRHHPIDPHLDSCRLQRRLRCASCARLLPLGRHARATPHRCILSDGVSCAQVACTSDHTSISHCSALSCLLLPTTFDFVLRMPLLLHPSLSPSLFPDPSLILLRPHSGMITSVGASLPLFGCKLVFFAQFGTFLCFTIAFSWLFANLFFMSAMVTFGPQDEVGEVGKGKEATTMTISQSDVSLSDIPSRT